MAKGTKVRYIANRRLKVGDGWREPGEEVPEAAAWMNVGALVSTGKLSIVPEEGATEQVEIRSQRGLERVGGTAPRQRLVPKRLARETEDGSAGSTEEEPSSPSSSETPESDDEVVAYDDMSIDEVKAAYEEGLLDADDIDEYEGQRAKGRRSGIDDWLMSLGDEDDDEG